MKKPGGDSCPQGAEGVHSCKAVASYVLPRKRRKPCPGPWPQVARLKQQPREPASGDWPERRVCVIVAALLHDWKNTRAPWPRAQQPWAPVQRVTLGQSLPLVRVTASTSEN